MDLNILATLEENQKIIISDGTKEPPLHHNRKHSVWQNRNKTCYFKKLEPEYNQIYISDAKTCSRINVTWALSLDNLNVTPA